MYRRVLFESTYGPHTLQNVLRRKLRKLKISNAKRKYLQGEEVSENDTFLLVAIQNKDMDVIKHR